ncbi:MAG: hypothetical protein EOM41_08100 [Bacilli bacterium]|nr:hypothetical protein [Bacilli bacterium]
MAKADQLFNQAIVESQRAKTLRPNKVADTTHTQMSIAILKAQAKASAANTSDISTFTTMVANDSLKRALRFGGATSEDLAKLEDGTLTEQEQEKMLNGVRKAVDHTLTMGLLSGLGLPGAYGQLAKQYDSPISSDASDILMKVGPANTPISDNVSIFTDTNGLMLKNDALATMSTFSDGKGVSASARVSARLAATSKSKILKTKANADAKFSLDFYGGKFTEVLVMGLPSVQSTLIGTMHNRVGYIPIEQLTARGYSLEDIALLGRVVQGDKLATKITKTISGDVTDGEAKTDKQTIATSISGKDRKYLEVKLVSKIPTEISSEIKSTLDAGYNTRVRKIGSKLNFAQAAHSEEE